MDHQEHIDQLLERYLGLLDTYTQLRGSLASSCAGMYKDMSHTHALADRGTRYDQECYDKRMQASKRLEICANESSGDCSPWTCNVVDAPVESDDTKIEHRDPLRWFGLVVPMPLRDAQAKASSLITDLIPKLVATDAEMRELEIEIGRARQRRTAM